jgi:amidase
MAANVASFPIEETSIAALQAAYLSGRATAVSVCQAHLERIAAYDRKGPALGATQSTGLEQRAAV